MLPTYSTQEIANFYGVYGEWPNDNPYTFTDGYVATDPQTGINVSVVYNANNLDLLGSNVIADMINLGSYKNVQDELERGAIPLNTDVLNNACIEQFHGSDTGIDNGWAITVAASGFSPEDTSRWADVYQLIAVQTCIPDGSYDFDEYYAACWNAMQQELQNFC